MKITVEQIKKVATNDFTFKRGLTYYSQGKVTYYKIKSNNGEDLISATVSGNQQYEVELVVRASNIVQYQCECEAYNTYKGACKHIVATLITYSVMSNREPVKVKKEEFKTDRAAVNMIASYQDQSLNEAYSLYSQKKVSLIPSLGLDSRKHLYMQFTIGHDRQYIVKDMAQFCKEMHSHAITEYGKRLKLLHHLDSFTADSQPLVSFILNHYREPDASMSYHYDRHYQKRNMYLSHHAIGDLFTLYKDKTMLISHDSKDVIDFTDDLPQLLLKIDRVKQTGYKVSLNHIPTAYFAGERVNYMILDNTFYRLSHKLKQKVGILLQSFMGRREPLMIDSVDMRSFFTNVVMQIKDVVTLDVAEEIVSKYETIPLVAKLYLDMPQLNRVTGDLKFFYHDLEFNPFHEINPNESIRIRRDEFNVLRAIQEYFNMPTEEEPRLIIDDDERIYKLYVEGIDQLTQYVEIYATDHFRSLVRKTPNVQIGVRMEHHLLDLTFDVEEFPITELYDVLQSYKKNKKFHRLKDGSFVELENNSLVELSQIIDGLDLSKKELDHGEAQIQKYRALYIDQMIKRSDSIKTKRDTAFKNMVRDLNDVGDATFEVPEIFEKVIRNYQKTGFRWLKTLDHYGFGGILADDMGLGKTIQVMTLIESYLNEGEQRLPSLVVCPASLVLNWQMELNHFAPHITVLPLIGTASVRKELMDGYKDYDVVVTSYDYLKRDIEWYDDIHFRYHIIDEAQYIKNHNTMNAKSVKQIKSTTRFALTGTPVENSLAEIWSIFDFVMPGYLFNYHKFSKQYEQPIVKNKDVLVIEQLRHLVTPFVLRRLKKDVLKELPDKTETTLFVHLEGEQRKLYLAHVAMVKKDLQSQFEQEGFQKRKFMVLAMLTRLRQLCCHPSLYFENYHGDSAKLSMCMDLVQSTILSGHKILLFSQFTSMLDILKKELVKLGISHYLLEGATKKEDRKRMVDQFNVDDTSVFLISLKAGGTGLNLTGADVVIHFDPWWNISAQNQATDRTHRIGQKNNVTVYKLIAKDTIEEKIVTLQESKQELGDSIVVEDDGIITKMSEADIFNLFNE